MGAGNASNAVAAAVATGLTYDPRFRTLNARCTLAHRCRESNAAVGKVERLR